MRAWMLLAIGTGCWRSAPARPPEPSFDRAQPRMLPVPVATRTARIVHAESWIEIAIDGDEARAQALCEQAIDDATSLAPIDPGIRVGRGCDATPLPPVSARRAVLLVHARPVDEETYQLGILARTAPGGAPAHGTVTLYRWFADRAGCERTAAAIVAAHTENHRALEEATRRYVQSQLDRARAEEVRVCTLAQTDPQYVRLCQHGRADVVRLEQELVAPVPDRYRPATACRDG